MNSLTNLPQGVLFILQGNARADVLNHDSIALTIRLFFSAEIFTTQG